jgi:HK97 family phage major capsid protein
VGGSSIKYPRRTGSTEAFWTAESAARTASDMAFEQIGITPHELATYVDVSRALAEDNAYDLAGELNSDLAESFAIAEGRA